MIRESMQKGDFDNLSGSGKPLDKSDYNPYIDPTTHNINKILVNNGFKPEWIMLSKEIRCFYIVLTSYFDFFFRKWKIAKFYIAFRSTYKLVGGTMDCCIKHSCVYS